MPESEELEMVIESVNERFEFIESFKVFIVCTIFLTTREEFINEFYRKFDCKIPPMNLVILDKMCDDMAMKSMKCKARRECPEHYEEIDGHQCVDSSSTR